MRPTFTMHAPSSLQETTQRIRTLIDEHDHPIEGRVAGNCLMLVIPPEHRHFWSPWLHIELHNEDPGTSVQGRFAPNPSVWTGIMLSYIGITTLILFAAIFGFAQLVMERSPAALILIPILLLIAGILYWSSLIGQRLANDQMHELHNALKDVLKTESSSD